MQQKYTLKCSHSCISTINWPKEHIVKAKITKQSSLTDSLPTTATSCLPLQSLTSLQVWLKRGHKNSKFKYASIKAQLNKCMRKQVHSSLLLPTGDSAFGTRQNLQSLEADFFLWCCGPKGAMTSSTLRSLDHTQRHTTVGRTPLDEWSVRRRDLYLTTHNTQKGQTSMPPAGFEPTILAGEWPPIYDLDRVATGIGMEADLYESNQKRANATFTIITS
jgi:hypothetical protein